MRKFLLTCSDGMNSSLPLFPSLTKELFHIKTHSVLLEFLCLSLDQKSLSANGNPCIYAILIQRFRKATFLTQNVLMLVCYTKLPPCVFFHLKQTHYSCVQSKGVHDRKLLFEKYVSTLFKQH